jgi:hypothetical protein
MFHGGGRRRILSKDYTLLREDQDPDDIESSQKKRGASAWRLISLAKEQALVGGPLLTTNACPGSLTPGSLFDQAW